MRRNANQGGVSLCVHWIARVLTGLVCAAALLVGSQAAAYPDRPIRMLVGYAPGGGADMLARFLAQRLGPRIGQPIIVENKAGAGGILAARDLANAKPDGYTLFFTESSSLVAPALQPVAYDPVKDFQLITKVGTLLYGIAVHPDLSVSSLTDLMALIRQNPGKYHYGSPGVGNIGHLAAERLIHHAKLEIEHVPYKGGSPMLADLMAGQIQIGFTSLPSLIAPMQGHRVRLLGVTSMERSTLYPDIPAIREIVPAFSEAASNIYVVAPAGTPLEAIRRLNTAINEVMRTEDATTYFAQQGALAHTGTPDVPADILEREVRQWGELVEAIGFGDSTR